MTRARLAQVLATLTAIGALAFAGCGGSEPSAPPPGVTSADWTECLRYWNESKCVELTTMATEMNKDVAELNADIADLNEELAKDAP